MSPGARGTPRLAAGALALALGLPASAEPARHEVAVGVTRLGYRGFLLGTGMQTALDVAYAFSPGPADSPWPLHVGGGLRAARAGEGTALPLELYLRGAIRARLGPWEPAVGPELGYSPLTRLEVSHRGQLPSGIHGLEQQRLGAWYFGCGMAPLRFRAGRWTVSALELMLGTTLRPAGAASRAQLGLLSVGYTP